MKSITKKVLLVALALCMKSSMVLATGRCGGDSKKCPKKECAAPRCPKPKCEQRCPKKCPKKECKPCPKKACPKRCPKRRGCGSKSKRNGNGPKKVNSNGRRNSRY